ncbi:MAG TPA: 50S ribosomal protein L30 [Myxococcaceae bacterium]|nr:50S ribosomal protein L30 [Myxococcaceae bacterium]
MGSLKVTLKKSFSGSSADQLAAITGLGLRKFGDTRLLPDTPEVRGMVFKMQHLVSAEPVQEEYKKRKRMKPRKVRAREAARAKRAQAAPK